MSSARVSHAPTTTVSASSPACSAREAAQSRSIGKLPLPLPLPHPYPYPYLYPYPYPYPRKRSAARTDRALGDCARRVAGGVRVAGGAPRTG